MTSYYQLLQRSTKLMETFMRKKFLTLLSILILGFFLTNSPILANTGNSYTFEKIGGGRTFETALFWSSATRGYYYFPNQSQSTLTVDQILYLNHLSGFLMDVSGEITGYELNRNNFAYGYEASGAWVADSQITEKIDLTVLGKSHYWIGESKKTYLGLGLGFAYNELRQENYSGVELNTGGHLFGASELEIGTRINFDDTPHYLSVTWAHRSNGGTKEENTGINAFYLSLARRY